MIKIQNEFINVYQHKLTPVIQDTRFLVDNRLSRVRGLKQNERDKVKSNEIAISIFYQCLSNLIEEYQGIFNKCQQFLHALHREEVETALKIMQQRDREIAIFFIAINEKIDILPTHKKTTYQEKCRDAGHAVSSHIIS